MKLQTSKPFVCEQYKVTAMRFLMFLLIFITDNVMAEVCDRTRFNLTESIEGDDSITRERVDFSFESGFIEYNDGAKETVYCIRNNHDEFPVYFRWHGPNPDNLFVDYVAAGGKWGIKVKKRYEDTESGDRTIEFGETDEYGEEEDVDTLFFVAGNEKEDRTLSAGSFIRVQDNQNPLEQISRPFSEILGDKSVLNEYMAAYRNWGGGDNDIDTYSYSMGWIPANPEALAVLARGDALEGYGGPYIPISYGIRSRINVETQELSTISSFWLGHFNVDSEALAIAAEWNSLNTLSMNTLEKSFQNIAEINEGSALNLSEALEKGRVDQFLDAGEFPEGKISAWGVGLAFEGRTFSAIHADVFEVR